MNFVKRWINSENFSKSNVNAAESDQSNFVNKTNSFRNLYILNEKLLNNKKVKNNGDFNKLDIIARNLRNKIKYNTFEILMKYYVSTTILELRKLNKIFVMNTAPNKKPMLNEMTNNKPKLNEMLINEEMPNPSDI